MTPDDVSRPGDRERHRQYVERLAALGSFAVGLAHELNSPISVILSRIELMIMEGEEHRIPELLADLRVLHRQSQRLARIAQALLSFGREHQRARHPIDLSDVLRDTLLLAGNQLSRKDIHFDTVLDAGPLQILGDRTSLEQILVNLLNLLLSARDAMSSGGTIRIETAVVPTPSQRDAIRLVVSADGMPESLFTTADGTALGFAVASAIVRDHGGTVDMRAEPGGGITFTFVFPIADGAVK